MTLQDFRCETCMRRIGLTDGTDDCPIGIPYHTDTAEAYVIEKVGCASHSSFQNKKETSVLDAIERTKNFGEVKNPDGSTSFQMKLDVRGSVRNAIRSAGDVRYADGLDSWGIKEFCRLYGEGRKAWLDGDLETVADMFGILV